MREAGRESLCISRLVGKWMYGWTCGQKAGVWVGQIEDTDVWLPGGWVTQKDGRIDG